MMRLVKRSSAVFSVKKCSAMLLVSFFCVSGAFAAQTIGSIAGNITTSMSGLAQLVISIALVAGMGFALASILKFKQHKDNPTQIPVGTPIALLFIAAALMFLPVIFGAAGATVFGSNVSRGSIIGSGTEWTS